MNDLQFKRHLKDLANGHHHPEEHDWNQPSAKPSKKVPSRTAKRAKNGKK